MHDQLGPQLQRRPRPGSDSYELRRQRQPDDGHREQRRPGIRLRHYCYDALNQLSYREHGAPATPRPRTKRTRTTRPAIAPTRDRRGRPTNFAYRGRAQLCDIDTGSAASCTGRQRDLRRRRSHCSGSAAGPSAMTPRARLVSACDDADCVGPGFDRVDFTYDGEGHRTRITVDRRHLSRRATSATRATPSSRSDQDGDRHPRLRRRRRRHGRQGHRAPTGASSDGTYLVTWNGHGDALALRVDGPTAAHPGQQLHLLDLGRSRPRPPTTAITDLGFRFLYVGAYDVQWRRASRPRPAPTCTPATTARARPLPAADPSR